MATSVCTIAKVRAKGFVSKLFSYIIITGFLEPVLFFMCFLKYIVFYKVIICYCGWF